MKSIIFDRDGIIIKCMPKHEYLTQASQIEYLVENIDVFKKIKKEIPIFIVTNQPEYIELYADFLENK